MDQPALDLAALIELETGVWQALQTGDVELDLSLLAPDFLGVYDTGFAGRESHADQIAEGPSVVGYRLSEPHGRVLADGCHMLSYRADFERSGTGRWDAMFVTSIWNLVDGRWLNTFSQDTSVRAGLTE